MEDAKKSNMVKEERKRKENFVTLNNFTILKPIIIVKLAWFF